MIPSSASRALCSRFLPRAGAAFLLAALLLPAPFANAFQVDFSKDAVEELFDGAAGNLPGISQGMAALPARIQTRVLPVEAGKKYKLQMTAKVDGGFVVEENDRAHIEALQRNHLTSTYNISFQDGNGEAVPPVGGGGPSTGGFFLTKNAYPYVMVFYVPEGATGLKVAFQSSGRTTYLSDLKLAEETEEGTLNANPDFRYGELNYCGWKPQGEGRIYRHPDGTNVLNTGFHYFSPPFPLSPKSKYRVSATGEGGDMGIDYFNKEGKFVVQGRPLLRLKPEGTTTEFTPPEGTVVGRLTGLRSQIIREVRIVEEK